MLLIKVLFVFVFTWDFAGEILSEKSCQKLGRFGKNIKNEGRNGHIGRGVLVHTIFPIITFIVILPKPKLSSGFSNILFATALAHKKIN